MGYTVLHDAIALETKGHDFVNSFQENDWAGGVVCDGVSSSYEPAWGAKTAGGIITHFIQEGMLLQEHTIDYHAMYGVVLDYFNQCAAQLFSPSPHFQKSLYATTVITAMVGGSEVVFSYCGNGAILEIRAEWFQLPDHIPTPWGVTNYLNPHSRFIEGENRLFKVVKATEDPYLCMPEVICLKREEPLMSYFLVCSDGLYSSDEMSSGWDEEANEYYIIENKRLILFLQLLKKYHAVLWENKDNFQSEYRSLLVKEGLIDDDLSYFLLIPEL